MIRLCSYSWSSDQSYLHGYFEVTKVKKQRPRPSEFLTAILEQMEEVKKYRSWKENERKINSNVEVRPTEDDLRKLDSNLKKNTAFVRKIKTYTESQKTAILKDISSLNLNKYIGEISSAITEAKLKMSDVQS